MQDTPETPGTGGPDPAASPTPAPTAPPPPPPPPPPPGASTHSAGTSVGPRKGVFDRARDILTKPDAEWRVIDAEPATVGSVFIPYALILAAIGPLAGLIGGQIFGINLGLFSWTPPLGTAIGMAVLGYVVSLVMVFVAALVIDALAPSFGGTKNQVQATKVAVYAWTAAWVAGIFSIIPVLGLLALVGLIYSLYLLYLGLPILMRVPADKTAGYAVVVILAMIVLYFIVGYIVAQITMRILLGGVMPGIG
jgi:hypothetical protein